MPPSELANPYHLSPHYYQAYAQAYLPRTTAEGNTPTHHPKPIFNHGSWYQPGSSRCTRRGCSFTGSRKSVEIHMMDRHFIFPLGWEKKNDWDADPSLKGKPIAIQGTSIRLDTPEAVDGWIAERKRRFPTDEKIHDKKRKLEEAAARGQLTLEDIGAGGKRHRPSMVYAGGRGRIPQGRGQHRGKGRGRQRLEEREKPRANETGSTTKPADTIIDCARETDNDDDDGAPEVVSSKIPTALVCNVKQSSATRISDAPPEDSKRTARPKKLPRNPFASRPTLLRNLLLPEIRITVSNLSQAIRFLVENDFLCGVELRPGEAQERMIEVIGSSETPNYDDA